jgi:Acetyltransferase (GNAT) domain
MKPIIAPISRELIKSELTDARYIRKTNYGDNKIFIVNHHNAPNVMLEIGRLREVSFRGAGGGTGEEIDIDENDTCEEPYQQLIVWNEEDKEIIGGYRYILCRDAAMPDGTLNLSTAHLFNFSEKFVGQYIPFTIELGRSWVQPAYQPSVSNRKGLFSLDNLWDGLGALIVMHSDMKYFFGKVTMYPSYNVEARDWLMAFMQYYFPDTDKLVTPITRLEYQYDILKIQENFKGLEYKEGYKALNQKIRQLGENIPPLINSYMNLSPSMHTFGTAINDLFGDVEETGIMITIDDIYESKKHRHIENIQK